MKAARQKIVFRLLAFSSFAVASGIIIFVGYPLAKYQLNPGIALRSFISPVPEQSNKDLTLASNWFDTNGNTNFGISSGKVVSYNISIGSLGIKGATVNVGGEDLSDSLIQYPGTALPGKSGNTVIFGHSVLPQFFNPKNYISIFSTLPDIKKGAKIGLQFDGIAYTYQVQDKFEVLPTDLEVLEQNESTPYLSLITCVPPGDPRRPRRLIVRAKLVANEVSYLK